MPLSLGTQVLSEAQTESAPLTANSAGQSSYGAAGAFSINRFPTVLAPLFDSDDAIQKKQKGLKYGFLERPSFFLYLLNLPWSHLLLFSIASYVAVVTVFAVLYFLWGEFCDAGHSQLHAANQSNTTFSSYENPKVLSYYFSIVSLAANGGYLSEPEEMINASHACFTGRTVLVGMCSYTNIVFVGLVAALLVGKAASKEKLGKRILFSDSCVMDAVENDPNVEGILSFRVADLEPQNAVLQGTLKLYLVKVESGEGIEKSEASLTSSSDEDDDVWVTLRKKAEGCLASHSGSTSRAQTSIEELEWSCEEEKKLPERGSSTRDRSLLLWYPGTITHQINGKSPLHAYFHSIFASEAAEVEPPYVIPFQLIAVYEAVEQSSGGLICGRKVYTPQSIQQSKRFSRQLIRVDPSTAKVNVDFYFFNALRRSRKYSRSLNKV